MIYVTKDGRVFKNGKELKQHVEGGYKRVYLKSSPRIREYVHRMVAIEYVKNDDPLRKDIVHHKDHDKFNNDWKNLEWVTTRANIQMARDLGLGTKSLKVIDTKGKEQVFKSIAIASRELGIHNNSIQRYCKSDKYHRGYKFIKL